MMKKRGFAIAALLLCAVAVNDAQAVERMPVEAFAERSKISSPKLSPDGKHFSVAMDLGEGNHALMVFDTATMKPSAFLHMPRYELPLETYWVSDTRLVVAKGKESGPLDKPLNYGEVIATDYDGKNQKYVYGPEEIPRIAGLARGAGFVSGLPLQPNGHFYMRQYRFDDRKVTSVYDVDAVKVTGKLVAEIGARDMDVMPDANGVPRFAYGGDENDNFLLFSTDGQGGRWQPVNGIDGVFEPVSFTADNRKLIARLSVDGGAYSLVLADPDGGNRAELAKDDFGSIGDLEWNAQHQPFAAVFDHGRPHAVYFDPDSPDAQLHKALNQSFPDRYVTYVNHSSDGNLSLLYAYSDRDPGAWYLFDHQTGKVSKLLNASDKIDPAKMGERRYLRFTASDGVELDAWLTIPNGVKEPSRLPMVLLPHGGPHIEGDGWAFDGDAQFLASRGYLVLQVNYRGTLGRGRRFQETGYRVWGTRVQDDLTDGVRAVVAQGYADPNRICAFGASFGGYSAMMATIRAPGLFKCAAGESGLYDLKSFATKSDTSDDESGQNYLARTIGTDPAEWAKNSPVSLAAQIKVPVFLAHGEDDQRTPYAQAKAMRDALAAAGNAPEWMSVPHEGHGFYSDANNVAFLNALQAFLERNIGPGVE